MVLNKDVRQEMGEKEVLKVFFARPNWPNFELT